MPQEQHSALFNKELQNPPLLSTLSLNFPFDSSNDKFFRINLALMKNTVFKLPQVIDSGPWGNFTNDRFQDSLHQMIFTPQHDILPMKFRISDKAPTRNSFPHPYRKRAFKEKIITILNSIPADSTASISTYTPLQKSDLPHFSSNHI